MRILIIEANTPVRVAQGQSGAAGFLRSLCGLGGTVRPDIVNPFERVPEVSEFTLYDGVIFTGSGEPWCVDASEVAGARRAMERAIAAGAFIWGSCNGMQLAAHVLGGVCGASVNGIEFGVARDLRLTLAGRRHPMMAGRQDGFAVPCIHRDVVTRVPEGAEVLAGNAHAPVQAFAWTDGAAEVWATQYHPELDLSDIATFLRADGIFADLANVVEDLDRAALDPEAQARLGIRAEDLMPENRARELGNWLIHVAERAARRCVA